MHRVLPMKWIFFFFQMTEDPHCDTLKKKKKKVTNATLQQNRIFYHKNHLLGVLNWSENASIFEWVYPCEKECDLVVLNMTYLKLTQ